MLTTENNSVVPKWIAAITVGSLCVAVLLISAVWFNLNSQLATMKQDFQLAFADIRGDVRVLQTKNEELVKNVAALTQRITDLVDRLDPPKWGHQK